MLPVFYSSDVVKIECTIQMKLTRRTIDGSPAPVIVLPDRRWRSFGPTRSRKRRAI